MDRAGLVNKVKIKMDEFAPEGASLPFDEYIGPTLDDSAIDLLGRAPLHLLTPTALPLTGTVYNDDKSYIPVPADYIRLYEIKYPLWKKSVRKTITTEDPLYKIQENEYTRAGYARPFVADVTTVVSGGSATRYLECGKVVSPATPSALYVKKVKPEVLNDIFADALSWLTASKLFSIMGYADKAKLMMEQFNNSILAIVNP